MLKRMVITDKVVNISVRVTPDCNFNVFIKIPLIDTGSTLSQITPV